jgi:acetyl-CoA C-acetyltransferase
VRPTWWMADAGATAWVPRKSMTACFATVSTMRFQASIRAGIPRILSPGRRSAVPRKTVSPRSQQRFGAAQKAGKFADEIVAVEVRGKKGVEAFASDEAPRPDTTVEGLAKLRPAFRDDGTITAGNAPGLNSGAAAMIVADRTFAERKSVEPMVRLVSYGVAAVEPGMFGLGPVPAVRKTLERAGWRLADVERIEINEAFAAVPLAVAQELGLPEDIINVEGGAVAHGHPIGATGAVLATRLIHSMRRDGLKRGMVTLCIGGGQGIALAIERIA